MAITVKTTLVSGNDLVDDAHATGEIAEVHDGHLYVINERTGTVAVYAPGKWVSATVQAEEESS